MIYDELLSGGETAIASLIGRQETLQLEFKANDPRDPIFANGELTKPGRKILAKEISAFANSAGGLLVFGVDCRVVDKVDQADKLTPIPSLARAETAVRDAASELLQPRHDGIRVASIPSVEELDTGYIIIDVPRSERRPHRSEATDQKQYFKRSGASAFAMEHYDIEDAFRRVSTPDLTFEASYEYYQQIGEEYKYKIKFAVENVSDVTAKMINLQLSDIKGIHFEQDPYTVPIVRETYYDGKTHLAGPIDFALHPGERRIFHHYKFTAHTNLDGSVRCGGIPLMVGSLRLSYSLSAENMRMKFGTYQLSGDEMCVFEPVISAAERRKLLGFNRP
ncbi:AlbA family DNA-binding domain-containing protein [Agrobacterium tumefaciens]|uniref:AlbA family DNA-binding domain-containing protein n=1 Tax=Agrobacterium tumefaciens TaxID=358 RepID=UPI0001FC5800|nr:ATP-binding protein [Agrobacterium tumefaciens]ADY64457.1 putative transcriptional regulator [Agrobacterium tumefaciens]